MLRLILLVLGGLLLAFLIWHIGPQQIYRAVAGIGLRGLLIILTPSVLIYLVDALGWVVVLRPIGRHVSFARLFAIRMAGEVVNMTTPTAYVGGEPVKAYILKQHQVPMVSAVASVVIAKTTMTIAQVTFMGIGTLLGMWLLWGVQPAGVMIVGGVLSGGLFLFGLVGLFVVQRYGLFAALSRLLALLRVRPTFVARRHAQLRELDGTILGFYATRPGAFYASIGLFGLGFLIEALEVYVILSVLDVPVGPLRAVAIGGLALLIKSGSFFIPGSLGAQDGGNLLLLAAFGYADVTGMTFALIRRLRELVWIGFGVLCLTAVGGRRHGDGDAEVERPRASRPPEVS